MAKPSWGAPRQQQQQPLLIGPRGASNWRPMCRGQSQRAQQFLAIRLANSHGDAVDQTRTRRRSRGAHCRPVQRACRPTDRPWPVQSRVVVPVVLAEMRRRPEAMLQHEGLSHSSQLRKTPLMRTHCLWSRPQAATLPGAHAPLRHGGLWLLSPSVELPAVGWRQPELLPPAPVAAQSATPSQQTQMKSQSFAPCVRPTTQRQHASSARPGRESCWW